MKKDNQIEILKKKPRAANKEKAFKPRAKPVRCATGMKISFPKEVGGRLTAYGIYIKFLLQIQNGRKLASSTCVDYDRLAINLLLPVLQNKAYADFTTEEFTEVCKQIRKNASCDGNAEKTILLLRVLHEVAMERGYTNVPLVVPEKADEGDLNKPELPEKENGPIQTDSYAEYPVGPESEEERAEGKADARKRLNNNDYIPLPTIVKICRIFMDGIVNHGEYLAALFVFLLGMRPSEALAFVFGELIKVGGVWCLPTFEVLAANSRETQVGVKSINGYRYIPIPDFLVRILLRRKQQLEELYGVEKVASMPICCNLAVYTQHATQKELNAAVKNVFSQVGLGQMADKKLECSYEINSGTVASCEKCYTTYLGRHFTATCMVAVDMPIDLLQLGFGHDIENSSLNRRDANNPDMIRRLKWYWDQLPVIQILNQDTGSQTAHFNGDKLTIVGDNITVRVQQPGVFNMQVTGNCYGDIPDVQCVEGDVIVRMPIELGQRTHKSQICNKNFVLPPHIREAYMLGEPDAPIFAPALSDEKWVTRCAQEIPFPEMHEDIVYRISGAETEERFAEKGLDKVGMVQLETIEECITDTAIAFAEKPTETELLRFKAEDFEAPKAKLENLFLCLWNTNPPSVTPIPEEYAEIKLPGKRGGSMPEKYVRKAQIFQWKPECKSFFAAQGGDLKPLDLEKDVMPEHFSNGVLVAVPNENEGILVCLTDHGNIQLTQANTIRAIDKCERLVKMSRGEQLVSCCYLPAEKDLLIVTYRGWAIRLAREYLNPKKGLGTQVIAGISCALGDVPCCCLPYPDDDEAVAVTKRGKLFRIGRSCGLDAQKRNSKLNCFLDVDEDDGVLSVMSRPEVLVLLDDRCKILCVDTEEILLSDRLPAQSVDGLTSKRSALTAVPTEFAK